MLHSDWNQSAYRLGGAGYGGLDMLNVKMMQIEQAMDVGGD